MAPDLSVQLGQISTVIIGSLGIGVALVSQRRQLNAQMFIEFSRRFQDLLRLFPTEAWLANRNPTQPLPPPSQEITDCTLYCVQFIADVYYLHQSRYIPKSLWVLWEREIYRTLSGPIFQREWDKVKTEFSHDSEFLRFLGNVTERRRQPKKLYTAVS